MRYNSFIGFHQLNDTPDHIHELQLELRLVKTPGERLYQFIMDNDATYQALREYKIKNNLPLGDLDPVGEYLKKKKEASENIEKRTNS